MAVFDYRNETFLPPPCDQLECGICHCVFYNPMECPCQHMFCEDCITQWLRDHGTCPECRRVTLTSSLTRASRVIRNVILNLRVQCQNRCRGCQEVCSVEHYEVHRKNCPYQLTKCPNGNCGLEVMLKDKAKHEDTECVFYLASCPVCKEYLIRHALLDHNCFRVLKEEVEFAKEQLRKLQAEKNTLQAQVEDLNRRQVEMREEIRRATHEIRDRRDWEPGVQREACETVRMLQNNMETVRNMTCSMQSLVKFSKSQMSRISIFLAGIRT